MIIMIILIFGLKILEIHVFFKCSQPKEIFVYTYS